MASEDSESVGKNTSTQWERTAVQNLLRNRTSGRYYGRWVVAGKQKWVSLKTDVFGVAKLRLADESAKIERTRGSAKSVEEGTGTVGDIITVYKARVDANSELRPASKARRHVALKKLLQTWPGIEKMKPSQITAPAVADWAARLKAEQHGKVAPGAKTGLPGNSATSVNSAIDTLKYLLEIAVERGVLHANPVAPRIRGVRLKKRPLRKKLSLPTRDQVKRLFEAMENNGSVGGRGVEAADLCRGLMYSGARLGEMHRATWACVDWERRLVHIPGVKTVTSERIIPLFPDLEELLKKVQARRVAAAAWKPDAKPETEPHDKIFQMSECQRTIDAAASRSGAPRITHHDFRHLFATICIESGVDIPTVSRWLGHADGGALAMKTYGHLRQDHSQSQAAKVVF